MSSDVGNDSISNNSMASSIIERKLKEIRIGQNGQLTFKFVKKRSENGGRRISLTEDSSDIMPIKPRRSPAKMKSEIASQTPMPDDDDFSRSSNEWNAAEGKCSRKVRSVVLEKQLRQRVSCTIIVVLGFNTELSKKCIFPAIWSMYKKKILPSNTFIVGYGRSKLSSREFKSICLSLLPVEDHRTTGHLLQKMHYVQGSFTQPDQSWSLVDKLESLESKYGHSNRLFFLATVPRDFQATCELIKNLPMSTTSGKLTVIIDRLFYDMSGEGQGYQLHRYFSEEEIRRINIKQPVQMHHALMSLRFANRLLMNVWSKEHIASVHVTISDTSKSFTTDLTDKRGLVNEIMQSQFLALICSVAMEKPASNATKDFRREKIRVLKSIKLNRDTVTLGNTSVKTNLFTGKKSPGFKVTLASMIFQVDNERWDGVPFILHYETGTNVANVVVNELRIQFRAIPKSCCSMFPGQQLENNEIVLQMTPKGNVASKIKLQTFGQAQILEVKALDLQESAAKTRLYSDTNSYMDFIASILLNRDSLYLVAKDEIHYTWKLFAPVVNMIKRDQIKPIHYDYGPTEQKEQLFTSKYRN